MGESKMKKLLLLLTLATTAYAMDAVEIDFDAAGRHNEEVVDPNTVMPKNPQRRIQVNVTDVSPRKSRFSWGIKRKPKAAMQSVDLNAPVENLTASSVGVSGDGSAVKNQNDTAELEALKSLQVRGDFKGSTIRDLLNHHVNSIFADAGEYNRDQALEVERTKKRIELSKGNVDKEAIETEIQALEDEKLEYLGKGVHNQYKSENRELENLSNTKELARVAVLEHVMNSLGVAADHQLRTDLMHKKWMLSDVDNRMALNARINEEKEKVDTINPISEAENFDQGDMHQVEEGR
ncbi:MAG: hypothetical protein ACJAZS_000310, partial [Alteromonas naphthalenivorans]